MIEELSPVVLTADLPEHDLRAGDLGTVVLVHQGGKGYTVEFTALSRETVAVATLSSEQTRPTRANDIAYMCELVTMRRCPDPAGLDYRRAVIAMERRHERNPHAGSIHVSELAMEQPKSGTMKFHIEPVVQRFASAPSRGTRDLRGLRQPL
jgi:uncharacterized protein DUF4926